MKAKADEIESISGDESGQNNFLFPEVSVAVGGY